MLYRIFDFIKYFMRKRGMRMEYCKFVVWYAFANWALDIPFIYYFFLFAWSRFRSLHKWLVWWSFVLKLVDLKWCMPTTFFFLCCLLFSQHATSTSHTPATTQLMLLSSFNFIFRRRCCCFFRRFGFFGNYVSAAGIYQFDWCWLMGFFAYALFYGFY